VHHQCRLHLPSCTTLQQVGLVPVDWQVGTKTDYFTVAPHCSKWGWCQWTDRWALKLIIWQLHHTAASGAGASGLTGVHQNGLFDSCTTLQQVGLVPVDWQVGTKSDYLTAAPHCSKWGWCQWTDRWAPKLII
jgi:DNA-binding transcriptional regulator GbsR (MarR family)